MTIDDSTYPTVNALSPNLIEIDYGPYGEITLEQIKAAYQKHLDLGLSGKQGVLVRADTVVRADKEAQKFSSSPEICEVTSACAIIATSFTACHLGRMFIWMARPPFPTSLFQKRDEAIEWLEEYLEREPTAANH